jgi:hypothetical protein
MARANKSLTGVFGKFENEKEEKPVEKPVVQSETTETTSENEQVGQHDNMTVEDIKRQLMNSYEEKANRKTVEETHIRSTFLFDKELAKRLDKLSKKKKRGFKTMFMNKAIEALLDEIENE